MDDPQPLFRAEAVDYIRRGREGGRGDVVRVAPRWTAFAFWTLLLVAVAAVATASLVKVDRVRLAPAVVDGTTVRAVVPAGDAPRPGDEGEFALTRTGERSPARIRRVSAPQGGAVTVLAVVEDAPGAGGGVLEIKTGERRLIADLVPGSSAER
jgi:hypothetical protein